MRSKNILTLVFAIAAALVVLLAPRTLHAQTNYASTPLGGRSTLMGNTGVALAVDGAAPFLNPATIVRVEDNKFAFSVNTYSATYSSYSNFHAPGAVDTSKFGSLNGDNTNETQARADALPSTLCFFFTLKGFGKTIGEDKDLEEHTKRLRGRQKLGICLGVVDRAQYDYPALNFKSNTGGLTQGQSYSRNWNRFEVGPTFAFYQTGRIALGASLHFSYAQFEQYIQSSNVGEDAQGHATVSTFGSAAAARAFDMAAIVGATFKLNKSTHLGVSAQSQLGTIAGSYSATEFSSFTANGGVSSLSLAHGDFAAPVPFRLAAGIGGEWPKLRVEGDIFFYPPNPDTFRSNIHVDTTTVLQGVSALSSRDFTSKQAANAVVNSAMGVEWAWRPEVSWLGGLGTDFSAAQRLTPVNLPTIGTFAQDRVNHFIASAGLASHSHNTEVLLGAQFQYGWGQSYVLNSLVLPNQYSIIDTKNFTVIFIIGGSADLRSLAEAVETVKDVVVKKSPAELKKEQDQQKAEEEAEKLRIIHAEKREQERERKRQLDLKKQQEQQQH